MDGGELDQFLKFTNDHHALLSDGSSSSTSLRTIRTQENEGHTVRSLALFSYSGSPEKRPRLKEASVTQNFIENGKKIIRRLRIKVAVS